MIAPIYLLKSKLQYVNHFRNVSVPNEGRSSHYGWVVAKILQSPFLNSNVTGPMFIKFLHDVEALRPLSMRAYIRWYYCPFKNARANSKGGKFQQLQKAPKI